MNPDRILVDAWAPEYGTSFAVDEDRSPPPVDLGVEVSGPWNPVDPTGPAVDDVVFIDGVQRVDAQVTFVDGGDVVPGLAGSFAAGALRHRGGVAAVERVEVRRGIFTLASSVHLECGGVRYEPYPATDTSADRLVGAMTEQMRALEKGIAGQAAAPLVVIDGPLSGGRNVAGAVGVVKTHHQRYLPDSHRHVVPALAPGQRTPLFLTKTDFSRFSWYQRLPGEARPAHPWGGVVRCEVSESNAADARRLAERCAATLPRFASSPHRDPRAPQNLTPIGFLEGHLRHRLGDAPVLERLLRRACHAWRP